MIQFTNSFRGVLFTCCNKNNQKQRTISGTQYQLDKTGNTNKRARKTHAKQKTIISAQHNGCNLAFDAKF